MLEQNSIPCINPSVIWRSIDGEVVTVIPSQKEGDNPIIRIFNETGSRIWELVNGKNDLKKIAEMISENFTISYEEAFVDMEKFISCLEKAGLIAFKNTKKKHEIKKN